MAFTNRISPWQVRKDFSYGVPHSRTINSYVLTAGTAQTIDFTILDPDGKRAGFVLFSCNDDFRARFDGGTATIPVANITDGTGATWNPSSAIVLSPLNSISVIAPRNCILDVETFTYI